MNQSRVFWALALVLSLCGCAATLRVDEGLLVGPVDYSDFNLHKGRIFVNGSLTVMKAERFQREIKFVEETDAVGTVTVYLSSQGGDLQAMQMISNAIESCRKPVDIVVTGYCASAACYILQCASGQRKAYRNAIFGLHEPSGRPKQLLAWIRQEYEAKLRKKTKLPDEFFPLTARVRFLTSKEALEFGLIDEVIGGG